MQTIIWAQNTKMAVWHTYYGVPFLKKKIKKQYTEIGVR